MPAPVQRDRAVNILYISQYYPPEMGAPAARVSELAQHWIAAGHEVTVLTGFPNHPTGVLDPAYRKPFRRLVWREKFKGVSVIRTWLWPLPNRKTAERILNYSSFFLSACVTGSLVGRPDVVIATSPQLLVGLAGWWIAGIKRVPLVFEVRDRWPESLMAVGVGSRNSVLHRSLRAIAGFLYQHSGHIVVVTPAVKEHLISEWKVPAAKISVVPNGVETDLFADSGRGEGPPELKLAGKFVVSYIGTLGMAQRLETIMDCAAELADEIPQIVFLLAGEGAERKRLLDIAREKDLDNVRFLPQQAREKIPAIIGASDVCLVLLRKTALFKTGIPTKMLEYMSCARPVILGVDGYARMLLQDAGAGLYVEPEDSRSLAAAVRKLYKDPELRRTLGANGRQFILKNLSRKETSESYREVLEKLLAPPAG